MFRRTVIHLARTARPRALVLETAAFAVRRDIHSSTTRQAVRPFLLADIGEGIKECEVIQWFVEPGATVEEFDPICEVQSDKASVEITSRYSGTIKKLHYEAGEVAQVGMPLIDIDMEASAEESTPQDEPVVEAVAENKTVPSLSQVSKEPSGLHATLATPAVRRVSRELGIDIASVHGSGKDGRVMKEDILNHKKEGVSTPEPAAISPSPAIRSAPTPGQATTVVPLTPIQKQMFKAMTNSLTIPHFLYTDEVELDEVSRLRQSINADLAARKTGIKLSFMPFFIKALSLSLNEFPLLNAKVNTDGPTPSLLYRSAHNIGVAMDTPAGLLVPNIKDVANKSIVEIGEELLRLQQLGSAGKLGSADLRDGTITLSNIGTVGGTYVAPVIVDSEVAIGGLGRSSTVPRFDANMAIVPKTILNASWSGDHRVVDGVTMARMVSLWKSYVEHPERMLMHMK